ncbi:DUF3488 and transglutaminase-like domain-containing protein [Arthrobacter zhaoxinii]|uniref:DUF3488 and transglutaminase-like domain-containing protein n=1 Tax=Arthrobacter zhaoxinii TaxID=2964616 RepID=A0ABY5YWC7_9MICC|nr:DUF3488 and transglutaminase-like domain-containing protein [Arthrobacter zhaoxinii]UWX97950.1 DUF3488 and transglutaminase-like domain-containing protein [Arthrobacter zhaoxinii]
MSALLTRPEAGSPLSGSPQEPDPAPRGSSEAANVAVGAASALAVLLCSLSVHGVIEGWSWLTPLFFAILVPLAATAAARRFRVPQPLVPVSGMAVLACTLTWLFASSSSFLGFLPGPGTLARADALLSEARTVILTEVTPVQPLPGILFLCCAGIGLVAVLTDTLAATLRMPATAGLGLFAVLMLPAVLKPESLGTGYFLLAGAGYLVLLAAGARREQHGPGTRVPRPWLARATAVSASSLALALLLPAVLPGFSGGAFPEGTRFNFFSGSTGLNPVVSLGSDLRQPQSAGRITYSTSSTDPVYLRSTTLEDFSGSRWGPDIRAAERREGVSTMSPDASTLPGGGRSTPVVTRISSKTYSSPWLLAPYYPLGVTGAEGNWSWDPKTMTVLDDSSDSASTQDYQVLSVSPELTPEELARLPEVDNGSVDAVFTDLPADLPGNIRDAAAEAVKDASTPYAKAMAIQGYLRGPEFSYSLEAPVEGGYDGNGMSVLSEFLERKAGYCVHFAAAMAVMARQEGIPSRMALGYAPGQSTGDTPEGTGPNGEPLREFEVDSSDAHAWPELYFEGAGWVRFEPTPSRGSVPVYAREPLAPADATIRDDEDPRLPGTPAAVPALPQEAPLEPETVLEPGDAGGTAWLGALLGVLAAAAAVLTPWAMRRRRAARRRHAAADGRTGPVWDELADLGIDYGYPGRTSDTPRTYAGRLAQEAGLSPRAEEALNRIRSSFEVEAYAGAGRGGPAPAPVWADLETVREELRRGTGFLGRIHARFLPPSLALRFRHG